MDRIIGAIYPVPEHLTDRLFDKGVRVFVKFLPHNTTKLTRRCKVIFYASGASKKLVGEGTIVRVEFLSPDGVIARYKDRLFVDAADFYTYVRSSPSRTGSKEVLTLVLRKLRKYPEPIDYGKPITMTGRYLSAAEYGSLIRASEK